MRRPSGRVVEKLARGLQKRSDLVGWIAAVPAWRTHRRNPTLPGPVRDGALGHLEQECHLSSAEKPAAEHFWQLALPEEFLYEASSFAIRLVSIRAHVPDPPEGLVPMTGHRC